MKKYEYVVIDSNENEHSLIALSTEIVGGHVCFYGISGLLHSFYHPVSALCLGEYNEETT